MRIDEHHHDTPATTTVMNANPEVTVAPSLTTSTTSPMSSPSPARPDLLKQVLTPYVNPLIGTEGLGHCITPYHSF